MILKNQCCYVSLFFYSFLFYFFIYLFYFILFIYLFIFLLNRIIGMSYIMQSIFFPLLAINSMISFWVCLLLLLFLFLFGIRLLPEQHKDLEVFTTDTVQLAATCSWFYTRLLKFCSMSLCKISFSYSPNARLPPSVLKKIDAISRSSHLEMFCKKGVLFCHVSMIWALFDLFCKKRLFSQETIFFPRLIYQR